MRDDNLIEIFRHVEDSLTASNKDIFKTCSYYGLYKAKGGKKEIDILLKNKDYHYNLLYLSFRLYYDLILYLEKMNARAVKTKRLGINDNLRRFYLQDTTRKVLSIFGYTYGNVNIQSDFGIRDTLFHTIMLGSSSTYIKTISTSTPLASKTILRDLALNHAITFYNSVAKVKINQDTFREYIIS